jgi:hypothetical protein
MYHLQVLTEQIHQRPLPEEVQINQADALGSLILCVFLVL